MKIKSLQIVEPERELPDIDIDLGDRPDLDIDGREFLWGYLNEKYGEKYITYVGTQGMYSSKTVLRDLGQVYGITSSDTIEASKEYNSELSVEKNIARNTKIKAFFEKYPQLRDKVDRIVGAISNLGVHAGGVIINDKKYPISTCCALYKTARSKGSKSATLFSKKELQQIGLIKYDFLGLKSAGQLYITKLALGLDPNEAFPHDEEVFKDVVLNQKNQNVFQFETPIGKAAFSDLVPWNFMELAAASGIIRIIGTESGRQIYNNYKEIVEQVHLGNSDFWKNKLEENIYEKENVEIVKQILANTYGIMIYQEQLAYLVQKLSKGNKTFSDGNTVRKLLDKFGDNYGSIDRWQGDKNMLKEWHTNFMSIMDEYLLPWLGKDGYDTENKDLYNFLNFNLDENNFLPIPQDGIIAMMISGGAYLFSVLHAIAYTTNTYDSMYLKHKHPLIFWKESLMCEEENKSKISKYISAIKTETDINVLPPSINKSETSFIIEDGNIRYGFAPVHGVKAAAYAIVKERELNGNFESIIDFYTRLKGKGVNKRVCENLTFANAFEEFGTVEENYKSFLKWYKLNDIGFGEAALAMKEFQLLGTNLTFKHPIVEQASYLKSFRDYDEFESITFNTGICIQKLDNRVTKKAEKPYVMITAQCLKTDEVFRIFDWSNNEMDFKEGNFYIVHLSKKGNFTSLKMNKNYNNTPSYGMSKGVKNAIASVL